MARIKDTAGNYLDLDDLVNEPGGGGVTVDNTVDAPAEVTTFVAPGADLSTPGEATLPVTILSRTVTLTDAQIKALPTTTVEVVPAPGAGKIIVPVVALLFLTRPDTYTNIDNPSFNLVWPGAGDATIYADGGLLSGDPSFVALHGASFDVAGSQYGFAYDSVVNKALSFDGNNGAGNFTGGGAGNSLRVTVLYTVLDVS